MRVFRLASVLGLIAITVVLALGAREQSSASHGPTLQNFTIDAVNCLNNTVPYTYAQASAGVAIPSPCDDPETKTAGGNPDLTTYVVTNGGARAGLPFSYTGPGWVVAVDGQIADGTVAGDIVSYVDLFCDNIVDTFSDGAGAGVPETYQEQTTAWTTTSGPADIGTSKGYADETFMDVLIPDGSNTLGLFPRWSRYRADATTLYLNNATSITLGSITPINLIVMAPAFSASGTLVNAAYLGGSPSPPGTQLLCLDTPQSSITHLDDSVIDNPASAGLYVRWTQFISAADPHSGVAHVKVISNCKAIGGAIADVDADCLSTTANPGASVTDGDDGNPDRDGDGLLDGIEVAWGTSPTVADTDGDGRSDLEEMIGPAIFLTDPTDGTGLPGDTDSDGDPDGGYCVDATGDGIPDSPDADGNPGTADGLHGANSDTSGDGSSHRISGAQLVNCAGGESTEGDNCGTVANADQANFDAAMPNGDAAGNLCDGDDDADGINDKLEGPTDVMWFDDDATPIGGTSGASFCISANGGDDVAISQLMSATDPDSDNDGYLDGVECNLGRNPASSASVPGFPAVGDADRDGLILEQERFWRTGVVSGTVNEDVDNDGPANCSNNNPPDCGFNDSDSDGDGLKDRTEALFLGTNPLRADSDEDGINDNKETFPGSTCGLMGYGNAHTKSVTLNQPRMGWEKFTSPWWNHGANGPTTCTAGTWRGLGDYDNDGLLDADEATGATACGVITRTPDLDITYDDDGDGNPATGSIGGTDATDDAIAADTDGDGRLDGVECTPPNGGAASNPLSNASKITNAQCAASVTADTDLDGLLDFWENCKWGTNPAASNTDGEGGGDCREVLDVDGSGVLNSTGDFVAIANVHFKAALTGKDGLYDLDGSNTVNSTGDFLPSANRIFATGGQPCL